MFEEFTFGSVLKPVGLVVPVLSLFGCGGGGGGGTVETLYAVNESDTVANWISENSNRANSETLTTSVYIIEEDYVNNEHNEGGYQEISLQFVTDEDENFERYFEIIISGFGSDFTLTSDDRLDSDDPYALLQDPNALFKINPDGSEIFIWTPEISWATVAEGRAVFDYLMAFYTYYYDPVEEIYEAGFGIAGLETPEQNMPSGTAAYSGNLASYGYLNGEADPVYIFGDIDLTAKFGSGTVNGRIADILVDDASYSDEFIIDQGAISGNGFETTVSVDSATCQPDCMTISSSEIDATFYGNVAQEFGGDISIEGTSSAGEAMLIQGIVAGQQD